MTNKLFAKLTLLTITVSLTGCAAAVGSAVGSMVLDEVTKGVVSNVFSSDKSDKSDKTAKTTPTNTPTTGNNQTPQGQANTEVKPAQPTENNSSNNPAANPPNAATPNTSGQNTTGTNGQPQCQNVDQAVNLPNGQVVHEKRIACLDEKTGSWRLVQ